MITWTEYSFEDLGIHRLYQALELRAEVFVKEQDCPYNDLDGRDSRARHLLGTDPLGQLVAYARWFPEEPEVSLGRIIVAQPWRGRGLGQELVRTCLDRIGPRAMRMHAQSHLERFYGAFGFVAEGASFLEDGIPHLLMRKPIDHQDALSK
ncbi:MAG: GNAT family N-acetyltransferase [Salinibacterium sp.]|nr:GNAT family N-acetyltransferase [Planctomycetota bacterium]MCB1281415.1 GNAT family N-acetyltransferase [Salinibacterium sp.]